MLRVFFESYGLNPLRVIKTSSLLNNLNGKSGITVGVGSIINGPLEFPGVGGIGLRRRAGAGNFPQWIEKIIN
jgi:hypothetical protein